MQSKNLEDLTELEMDGKRIVANGKVVDVVPIGEPWIIAMSGEDSEGNFDIYEFKKKANEYYLPPEDADSYVLGRGTYYDSAELSVRPIQAYKIVRTRRLATAGYEILGNILEWLVK